MKTRFFLSLTGASLFLIGSSLTFMMISKNYIFSFSFQPWLPASIIACYLVGLNILIFQFYGPQVPSVVKRLRLILVALVMIVGQLITAFSGIVFIVIRSPTFQVSRLEQWLIPLFLFGLGVATNITGVVTTLLHYSAKEKLFVA